MRFPALTTSYGGLAAALLGTPDPRRGRPGPACGLHPLEPGEAWPGRPRRRFATFLVSPVRERGHVVAGVGWVWRGGRGFLGTCMGWRLMRPMPSTNPLRMIDAVRCAHHILPMPSARVGCGEVHPQIY